MSSSSNAFFYYSISYVIFAFLSVFLQSFSFISQLALQVDKFGALQKF